MNDLKSKSKKMYRKRDFCSSKAKQYEKLEKGVG